MVNRNVSIIMEIMNPLKACEQIRHEFLLKGDLENYKEDIDVEK